MKKLVIGCLGAVVLVIVGTTMAGYFFVYRPARSLLASVAQLGQLASLDQQVHSTAPFTPPADGTLTAAMVGRYIQVVDHMQQRLGARAAEFGRKYEDLAKRLERSNNSPGPLDLPQLLHAYADLAGLLIEAKRSQVDALNGAGFSLAEYKWVRKHVYQAADLALMNVDLDDIVRTASAGGRLPSQCRSLRQTAFPFETRSWSSHTVTASNAGTRLPGSDSSLSRDDR